jgi:acyl carrier protein
MDKNVFLTNFAEMLEDTDPALISDETIFRNLDEWDSLTALSLIAMVYEQYTIKLTGEDINNSITIQDLFEKIKSKT